MERDGKLLAAAEIEQYRELGYIAAVDGMSPSDAGRARAALERHEATLGHALGPGQRSKAHYIFTWVDDIMRNTRVLDAVEDLIGPNILCWGSIFWIKEAQSPSYVGWHQDLQYWGLDTSDLVNVWVALSLASAQAGCMSVIPGTHTEQFEHVETYDEHSLLSRGQELTIDIGEQTPVAMPLAPGQFSMHNGRLAHGSSPNASGDRRIGLSLQYIPTSAKQTLVAWDTAALVRGVDDFNHFEHGSSPESDLHPDAVAFHERAIDALRELIYAGAERQSDPSV